jgi:tetratricopeptide (TPR) repeat protein
MVTDSASHTRNYWQLPIFFLGIAAMAAAYKQFPPPTPSQSSQAQSALATVRSAMTAKPMAWESVREQIPVLETGLDEMPLPDSPTCFLVGSWHLAAAEHGNASDAKKHWEQAARRFKQVEVASLETDDAARYPFRMAKVDAKLGTGKVHEVLFALLNNPAGEDISTRGQYVYDAAMRCTPPELGRARTGLEEYLTGPAAGHSVPAELAKRKLELGRLYLNDGKPTEAKQWLEPASGPTAEPDVRATAHIHLAQLATAQRNSAEAESRYKQAMAVAGLPAEQLAHVNMLCGEGFIRLEKFNEAATAFSTAAKGKGPIAAAASCRVAGINALKPSATGNRTSDVDALETCVASLKTGATWDNPHVTVDQVRQTFEDVIRACVSEGDTKSATRAVALYDRVALPGRSMEMKADMLMGFASSVGKGKNNEELHKFGEYAKAAATEYDAMAEKATVPALKVDALRKAAQALQMTGDKAAAQERLEKVLALPNLNPELMASVRMDLADSTNDPAKAAVMLQQIVESGSAAAYSARVKLASVKLDQAKLAKLSTDDNVKNQAESLTSAAVTLLEQAAGAATVSPLDQPAHEQALLTLGRVKMEQGQFADAANRLRTLLQTYPTTKESERAKLFLASCLLVEGTTGPGNPARVSESLTVLEPLMKSSDPYLRVQAGVRTARARLANKQWQEAISAATTTADEAKGTVEELIALSLAYNGYAEQKRAEQCKTTETRMRQLFAELPDAKFSNASPEYSRAYWKTNWFDWLDKHAGGNP